MTTDTNQPQAAGIQQKRVCYHSNAGDAVYGLGLIGAAIFYIGQATSFWMGVLGMLKAFAWPVFLVLEAFKALA